MQSGMKIAIGPVLMTQIVSKRILCVAGALSQRACVTIGEVGNDPSQSVHLEMGVYVKMQRVSVQILFKIKPIIRKKSFCLHKVYVCLFL